MGSWIERAEVKSREAKADPEAPLPDAAMEVRRQAVLAQLREFPNITRAVLVDDRADPEDVLVAVAIRGLASFELRIPRAKFDAERFMGLVDKRSIRAEDGEREAA